MQPIFHVHLWYNIENKVRFSFLFIMIWYYIFKNLSELSSIQHHCQILSFLALLSIKFLLFSLEILICSIFNILSEAKTCSCASKPTIFSFFTRISRYVMSSAVLISCWLNIVFHTAGEILNRHCNLPVNLLCQARCTTYKFLNTFYFPHTFYSLLIIYPLTWLANLLSSKAFKHFLPCLLPNLIICWANFVMTSHVLQRNREILLWWWEEKNVQSVVSGNQGKSI